MKIIIVGMGGVGGYYGGLLTKRYFDDEDVKIVFIAREDHLEQIKKGQSLKIYGNGFPKKQTQRC